MYPPVQCVKAHAQQRFRDGVIRAPASKRYCTYPLQGGGALKFLRAKSISSLNKMTIETRIVFQATGIFFLITVLLVSESHISTTVHYPYKCDVCHVPFKSESKFNLHKRKHTEEMPFLCSYCGESFKYFQEFSKHRNELHLGNKTFKCEQCEKSFSTRKELKQHMWRHTGMRQHGIRIVLNNLNHM